MIPYTAIALSNISTVCPAEGIFLTLPVPCGTVGNTIDFAYTPSSLRRLLNI